VEGVDRAHAEDGGVAVSANHKRYVDAPLTKLIHEIYPTAIVYKMESDWDDRGKIKFVNYCTELTDKGGAIQMVMLGVKPSEAKAAIYVLIRAYKARSIKISASATAIDPTCHVCGVLDCQVHKAWRVCHNERHKCHWDSAIHAHCPVCTYEGVKWATVQ
jgi:hypothetical protein